MQKQGVTRHPILELFEEDSGSKIVNDYFTSELYVEENERDYFDQNAIIKSPSYWFHHPLSEIFENVISHGFRITHFDEYALSLIHISEPTRPRLISYSVFCF